MWMADIRLGRIGRELAQTLRRRGCRFTKQRLLILSTLEKAKGHFSVDDIYKQIKNQDPKLHISTIYRNLELLRNLGLLIQTDLGEGRFHFRLREHSRHHYLICEKCGNRIEVSEDLVDSLKDSIEKKYSFLPDLKHLAIFGLCRHCA
jgi:Fur family ferric uptake transcriptional regulator